MTMENHSPSSESDELAGKIARFALSLDPPGGLLAVAMASLTADLLAANNGSREVLEHNITNFAKMARLAHEKRHGAPPDDDVGHSVAAASDVHTVIAHHDTHTALVALVAVLSRTIAESSSNPDATAKEMSRLLRASVRTFPLDRVSMN